MKKLGDVSSLQEREEEVRKGTMFLREQLERQKKEEQEYRKQLDEGEGPVPTVLPVP